MSVVAVHPYADDVVGPAQRGRALEQVARRPRQARGSSLCSITSIGIDPAYWEITSLVRSRLPSLHTITRQSILAAERRRNSRQEHRQCLLLVVRRQGRRSSTAAAAFEQGIHDAVRGVAVAVGQCLGLTGRRAEPVPGVEDPGRFGAAEYVPPEVNGLNPFVALRSVRQGTR